MDSKRLLLATVISIAIILGYQMFVARFLSPPEPVPGSAPTPAPSASMEPAAAPTAVVPRPGADGAGIKAGAPAAAQGRTGERVAVRTEQYELAFSTAGAALVEARLPDYLA